MRGLALAGLLVHAVLCEPLKWETYKLNHADAKHFIVTEAKIDGRAGHQLRVVRFSQGHPSAHIVLLPPAPGQGSQYWEGELAKLARIYSRDYVLYAPDLRGTLHASPFTDTRDERWNRSDVSSLESKDGSLRLPDISVAGLASDVGALLDRIREEAGFTGTVHLHARSFGTLVAICLLEKREREFASVMFESMLPAGSWEAPANDLAFLERCDADEFCRQHFGGKDGLQARSMLLAVGSSPSLNKCTKAIVEAFDKRKSGPLGGAQASSLRVFELLMPFLHGRVKAGKYHSAMLVLPFLQNAYSCPDPAGFATDILPKFVQAAEEAGYSRFEHFDRDVDVNRLMNVFLMMGEVFGLGSAKDHPCQAPLALGFSSPCVLFKYYSRYLKTFKEVLGRRSADYSLAKSAHTSLFFVGGALDLLTPLRATEEIYERSEGKAKRLIAFSNLGHHPLSDDVCSSQVGSEFLGRASAEATDLCLREANEKGLDWTFAELASLPAGKWWVCSAAAAKNAKPAPVPAEPWNWWLVGAGALGGLLLCAVVVAVAGIAWRMGRAARLSSLNA